MVKRCLAFVVCSVALFAGHRTTQAQEDTVGGPQAGIGFELATRNFAPVDSRFEGGSNVFRLNLGRMGHPFVFFEREQMSLTFKNSGAGAPTVTGSVHSEGIGISVPVPTPLPILAVRLDLLVGRATTVVDGAAVGGTTLNSSDPMMNLGAHWSYAVGSGFVDVGLIYRMLRLSGAVDGNVLDGTGTTATKSVDDLGGTLLHLGVGLEF